MPFAVITGATEGIGKAIAEKLLENKVSIAICARNTVGLQQLKDEWAEKYLDVNIQVFTADLSQKEAVFSFAEKVIALNKPINILVNNAGTFKPGNIATEQEDALEQMIATNLYSAYHLTRKLLPEMKKNRVGHIFNMCSIASLKAYPQGGSYSISKYALLGFSDNLREELKQENIKVTAICPGAVYTQSWAGSGVPEERIMETKDIAEMVWSSYNLSPQANVEHIILRPVKGDL